MRLEGRPPPAATPGPTSRRWRVVPHPGPRQRRRRGQLRRPGQRGHAAQRRADRADRGRPARAEPRRWTSAESSATTGSSRGRRPRGTPSSAASLGRRPRDSGPTPHARRRRPRRRGRRRRRRGLAGAAQPRPAAADGAHRDPRRPPQARLGRRGAGRTSAGRGHRRAHRGRAGGTAFNRMLDNVDGALQARHERRATSAAVRRRRLARAADASRPSGVCRAVPSRARARARLGHPCPRQGRVRGPAHVGPRRGPACSLALRRGGHSSAVPSMCRSGGRRRQRRARRRLDHQWRLDLPDEPVEIRGDTHRLHQVVANLANARTHTLRGRRSRPRSSAWATGRGSPCTTTGPECHRRSSPACSSGSPAATTRATAAAAAPGWA